MVLDVSCAAQAHTSLDSAVGIAERGGTAYGHSSIDGSMLSIRYSTT